MSAVAPRPGVRPGAAAALLTAIFVVSSLVGRLGLDGTADLAERMFRATANAHYQVYLARENINSDGSQEFAVLVSQREDQALAAYVERRAGWSLREALVPGWMVVTVPAPVGDALVTLREASFARAVLRNRGMWICH